MQEKAIALGRQLVHSLDLEPGVDTLSKWMAHYIAEQITAVENAGPAEKAIAERKCYQTILALWEHRATFPRGIRPLEKFDSILRALELLDPENPNPFYYHNTETAKESKGNTEADSVLDLVKFIIELDKATRILIEETLNEATGIATSEQTKTLLKNALPTHEDGDIKAIARLIKQAERLSSKLNEESKRRIRERIKRLDAFCTVCKRVSASYKRQLTK